MLKLRGIVKTLLGIGLLTAFLGCAAMQTWPNNERSAESRMVVIQEQIGEGLKSGALTPDQSQSFLTKLKVIQKDYMELRDQKVYRDKWDSLLARLDALGDEINRASVRTTTRIERPVNGDRIIGLQKRIDDGRINDRFTQQAGRDFQVRLDGIRSDYLRITEGARYVTPEERTDISRRLDLLSKDLDLYR